MNVTIVIKWDDPPSHPPRSLIRHSYLSNEFGTARVLTVGGNMPRSGGAMPLGEVVDIEYGRLG